MGILKRARNEVVFKPIPDGPLAGSAIAEAFDTQRYAVKDRVKHLYVCDPGNWKA